MNLAATISLSAGGLGSGCRGENCGRPDLFHVTHTRLVTKIKKEGLKLMQTSNWVKAGDRTRFGGGAVYSFENKEDAHRWAAKMDWVFNKGIGTGKVSIIKLKPEIEKWSEDTGDPLGRAMSKGKWLKYMGHVPPEQIVDIYPFSSAMVKKLL